MELLLLLIYAAICFAIFRVFRVPVNEYSIATAALGGVVIIGGILLTMNFNHPYTKIARSYFVATPIVPAVRGRVIEVPVQPNQPLAAGDVLFKIDPSPFEARVAELEARKAQVQAVVHQDQDRVAEAQAQVDSASAALKKADDDNTRNATLVQKGTIPKSEGEAFAVALDKARADLAQAEAALDEAQDMAGAAIADGTNAKLAEIEAQLASARWDLKQTTVVAPSDGYVTQVGLREGFYAVPFPLTPVMVFISEQPKRVVASFQQIGVQRLEVGDEAEIAFLALPGTVQKGRVAEILDVMATGELSPRGTVLAPELRAQPGRVTVLVDIEDDSFSLPGGSSAVVSVYTDHLTPFAIIRKVLLRIRAWQFYLAFEA